MSASKGRTFVADARARAGRLEKAKQFLRLADETLELDATAGDAAVSLYVLSGIAAADAICAKALGVHAQGQDHGEAVALLASVDAGAATALHALLGMKSRAGYGHDPIGAVRVARASRAAHLLLTTAQ